MKILMKTMAILLAVMMFCYTGMTAFAATDDNTYSITWVYEKENIVDLYHAGDTITPREATLSDGSIGGWSTDPNAQKAPMVSPVPATMPAQDLIFYAKRSYVSDMVDHVIDSIKERALSKEYWKSQHPLLWVFPYVWYHIYYFFAELFA